MARRSLGLSLLFAVMPLVWSTGAFAQASPTPPSPPPGGQTDPNAGGSGDTRGSLVPFGQGPQSGPTMGAGATGAAGAGASGSTTAIDPAADQQKLATQPVEHRASTAPNDGSVGNSPREVYSEDWWSHTRPVFEMHGYFRTRGDSFHNFTLGRHNAPGDAQNLWPQPLDQSYGDINGTDHPVQLCGDPSPQGALGRCIDKTQATANLRLRLNPEIHISDNLRIMTQIDLLNNLVLGSTPDAYAIQPVGTATGNNTSGYRPAGNGYNGYAPLGAFSTTQGPPTAGVNSFQNSVEVQRAWAEYLSPIGQFRFGRMPSQWGLGMVANAGEDIDANYQTNSDRIMFITGLKSMDLYFGGAWDFVSTGATNASPYDVYGGQAYNLANLTNVDEWTAFIAHRTNPELQRMKLSRGDFVINGGLYTLYRQQYLDVIQGQTPLTFDSLTASQGNNGLERRSAQAIIPDAWVQILYRKFRFEAEAVTIRGSIGQTKQINDIADPVLIRQYGLATQSEFRAIDDKLRLQFGFGWASGDPWVNGLNPGSSGLQPELNGGRGPISTFHFHPAYTVDLIFFREILSRVEGAYYFRPSVDYDFLRNPNGQKVGGGAAIIWSRASEFEQTPGKKRDLGVELDLNVYYQAKDGSLNDDPSKLGGFYAMLQYGVFFPLGGLDYMVGETQGNKLPDYGTSSAQTVRLFLGVAF